jgi:hypothetical protein
MITHMRWARYVTRMDRRELHAEFWQEILKDKTHWEDPGVDE